VKEQACVEKVGRGAVGEAELWELGVWLEEGERVDVGISIVSQMKVSRDGIAPLRSKNGEYASFASVSMGNVRRWQCAPSAPMSASSTEESTEAKFLGSRMCRTGKVGGSSPKECVSLHSLGTRSRPMIPGWKRRVWHTGETCYP
jgi:hypothetical protein